MRENRFKRVKKMDWIQKDDPNLNFNEGIYG